MYPNDLRYTKDHEWVRVEGGVATIGITHHAQSELKDIVYVDLEVVEPGAGIAAGDSMAAVESAKSASDIYAPVAGEVVALNEALNDTPELINQDPHGDGWIVRLRLSDPAAVDALMTAEAYAAYIQEEKEQE